jgi:hypothetical protein
MAVEAEVLCCYEAGHEMIMPCHVQQSQLHWAVEKDLLFTDINLNPYTHLFYK